MGKRGAFGEMAQFAPTGADDAILQGCPRFSRCCRKQWYLIELEAPFSAAASGTIPLKNKDLKNQGKPQKKGDPKNGGISLDVDDNNGRKKYGRVFLYMLMIINDI